jgi:hypothetical protein
MGLNGQLQSLVTLPLASIEWERGLSESQSQPLHILLLHFRKIILILSFHLLIDLSSDLLPSGFPTKILYGKGGEA